MRTLTLRSSACMLGRGSSTSMALRSPQLELRQESGQQLKIFGYASIFGVLSEGLSFKERVLKGSFKNSLANDIRASRLSSFREA